MGIPNTSPNSCGVHVSRCRLFEVEGWWVHRQLSKIGSRKRSARHATCSSITTLVVAFNPFETYLPKWESFPSRDENKQIFETTTYKSSCSSITKNSEVLELSMPKWWLNFCKKTKSSIWSLEHFLWNKTSPFHLISWLIGGLGWWFGFLGSRLERDCYFKLPLESQTTNPKTNLAEKDFAEQKQLGSQAFFIMAYCNPVVIPIKTESR